jgi:hypothetical protein
MLHALFNGTKLLGLFSDHEKCQIMMTGLINNEFTIKEKLTIKSFYENTITEGEYYNQEFSESLTEYEVDSEAFTTASDKPKQKPVIVELSPDSKKKREEEMKEKVDLQNSLYELKRKKEKLEESKRVYNVDLELYNRFKKIKDTNEHFEIPEMFVPKYELMSELESNDNLSWEAFHDKYVPPQMSTGYSKLFE